LDQRLFSLYPPGAELTLHASVGRGTPVQHQHIIRPQGSQRLHQHRPLRDGHTAAWLVALLNAREIRFVMRCDSRSGWAASKRFVRSGLREQQVLPSDVAQV
jgi:hypothetical protein